MSSTTLRLCVAVIILATALSQPRTPTVLIDVFSFIQQILSVPRRDATSTTADVSSEEVSQLIELFSTQASLNSNDPSAQQIAAQRLFPLHKQTLTNVSSACRNDSLELIAALLQRKLWAITVADAGFKLPSGVLQGDLNWLGSYSECINVTAQIKGNDQQAELFRAHYCSAMIGSQGLLSSQAVTLGLCVPRACTEVDMQHVLKAALSKVSLGSMTVTMTCLPKSTRFGPSEVILIVFLACMGAALLAGTLYDVIIHQTKLEPATTPLNIDSDGVTSETTPLMGGQGSKTVTESSRLVKTALALSLYSNGAKVLDASTTREGTLGAIHGMRFISMTWVMLGHVYVFGISSFKNPVILLSYLQRFTFQAIWNATVSVDSFFVMSGTLVSYLLLREMKRSGGPRKINWLHFYLHRYWRLTAPYVLVMAVWIILFPLMGSGPLWATQTMTTMCDSWWRNTLYINNLFPSSQECMGWMWYVANDLQFYLISPLILVPIFWSRIIGVSLIMVLIVVSFIINGMLSYEHQFVAGNAFVVGNQINITQMTEYFDVVYQTPWCRIGPYLVGMLLGYLLYITKGNVRMPRLVVVLGWTLAAVCNLSVLYGLYHMMNGHPISVSLSAFYNSVFRTVWAVGVAWVIFACVTGHGGFVNTLLSWPVLVPLSRLTYMTYLIHPIVYYFFFGTRQQLLMLDDTLLIVLFLGLLVLCYGLSFLLVITIESPMMALEKVFISRPSAGGRKHVDGQTDDRKTAENVNC